MDSDTRLLIIEDQGRDERGPLGRGIERERVLSAIATTGATVRHDSGGRLLVIETSDEADAVLQRELPGARILPVDEDVLRRVPDLDPSDDLFARALAIRYSSEYRERKSRLKPGETPEEQLLITAPCTSED